MVVFTFDGSVDRRASDYESHAALTARLQSSLEFRGGENAVEKGRTQKIVTATPTIIPSFILQSKLAIPPL